MDIVVELDFDNGPFMVFNALSYSWGLSLAGSGGSPQLPSLSQDVMVTADSSASTTSQLKSACELGSPLRRLTISAIDPASASGLKWTFDTAFVSSFQTGGDPSQVTSVDSFAVNFLTSAVQPI